MNFDPPTIVKNAFTRHTLCMEFIGLDATAHLGLELMILNYSNMILNVMKRATITLLLTFAFNQLIFAQNDPAAQFKAKIFPPSPEAASLGKYGDYPVSLNNGMANISVPLYEINTGKIKLPITLNYHHGGVKAYDISSCVGLGWSLSSTYVISRVVNGVADEAANGILNNPFPEEGDPGEHYACFVSRLADPKVKVDGQPDVFYLNVGSFNGKFIFKPQADPDVPHEIVTVPYSLLKIQVNADFSEFKVTDTDGTRYTFGQLETTQIITEAGADANNKTAWYITSILSADKSDSIVFTYTDPFFTQTFTASNSLTVKNDLFSTLAGNRSYSKGTSQSNHTSVLIKTISFKNGKVTFDYATDREDLHNGLRLNAITVSQVKNGVPTDIRKFNFMQSYFTAASGQTSQVAGMLFPSGALDEYRKKLRLDGLYEQGFQNGNTVIKPPYRFAYEGGDNLPVYGSTAQDFMGYYNAAHANTTLLFYDYGVTELGPEISTRFGANRSVNPQTIKRGVLTRVDYPTGGFTTFEVEANQVHHIDTVTETGVFVSPYYTVTNRDSVVTSVTFTVTLPAGAAASSLTAYFSCRAVNDKPNEPKISTSITLFDETAGTYALFRPTTIGASQAMYGLPASLSGLNETNEVILYPNHTYTLSYGTSVPPTNNFLYATVYYQANNGTVTRNINEILYTGGLRIKSIVSDDGEGNQVKKNYSYTKWYYNSNLFNGNINELAKNFRSRCSRFAPIGANGLAQAPFWYDTYGENITFSIGSSSNTVAAYEEVEEFQTDAADRLLGKTVTTYNIAQDQISSWSPFFRSDEEWKRSQIRFQKVYKTKPDGGITLIKEVANEYDNNLIDNIECYSSVLFQEVDYSVMQLMFRECGYPAGNVYKVGHIFQNVFKSDVIKTTTTDYDLNGENGKTTEDFFTYDQTKHRLLTRTVKKSSEARWLTSNFKYPLDYTIGTCQNQPCYDALNSTLDALRVQKTSCEQQNYDSYMSHLNTSVEIYDYWRADYNDDYNDCHQQPVCLDIAWNSFQNHLNDSQYDEEQALAFAAFDNYLACATPFHAGVQSAMSQFNGCETNYTSCITSFLSSGAADKDKALLIMQQNNAVAAVVDTQTGFIDGDISGTEYMRNGVRTDFKPSSLPGVAVPDAIWGFNANASATKAAVDANATPYYRKVGTFSKYDGHNNLTERSKDTDVIASFIWDYDAQYPVAEVINATSDDIAFTSFEADGTGNWTVPSALRYTEARTGFKCYDVANGTIRKSGLVQNRKYELSFWAKANSAILVNGAAPQASGLPVNGWQYYYATITGSASTTEAVVSGNGYIDEVRLAPANAQMTTYTYEPQVGVRSVTDANNQTLFYEYDALQRLKLIRDSRLNPVKTYTYHFAGQN